MPAGAAIDVLIPNGARKSTLVRLLLGFVRPSTCSVVVLGETNVERARSRARPKALRLLLDLDVPLRSLNPEWESLEDVDLRATSR